MLTSVVFALHQEWGTHGRSDIAGLPTSIRPIQHGLVLGIQALEYNIWRPQALHLCYIVVYCGVCVCVVEASYIKRDRQH